MKKYLFIATFFTAILGFAQTSLKVSSFSKIKIDANASIEIVQSDKNEIMFNASDEQMKTFLITSDDNVLHIKQNGESIPELRIRIYTNQLEGMELTGTGTVSLAKFTLLDHLYLGMKGNYVVNTGDSKIKNLVIARDDISKAIYTNATTVQESVNGTMLAGQ